jgi:hypothetical protein
MKRERHRGWRGKTLLLGAGSALAVGLGGGMVSPALAQTASAVSASLPTACPGLEALVSDEIDGPDPWGQGEVIRFATSLSQGTLTNNLSPLGAPNLDSPEDMAFDLNGNVVTADEGISTGVSQVVRVDRNTGVRTLISGPGLGSGPALNGPYSIAVEGTGNILVLDFNATTTASRLLRITPTGARSVLSSNAVGAGPTLGVSERVRVLNGVIYLLDGGRLLSVDAITGSRTLISGGGVGAGPAFALAKSVTTDATGGSLMVLDQNFAGTGALIRVNLATGNRTEVFSNRLQTGTWNFDMPYDVVRNACNNSFYLLHTGATGVPGNVLRVDGGSGARTLFATYTASSPPSNYSLLMRPLILIPGGGGPSGPSGPGGGGGGGGL